MSAAGRILFFTKGVAVNPASRYRFLQYLPYFEEAGFEVTVRPLFPESYYRWGRARSPIRQTAKALISATSLARRLVQLPEAREADLIVVENQLFPYEQGLLEELLFTFKRKVVVEFDDAIYLTPLHREKILRVLAKAEHVIVGNRFLADFARLANPEVSIVPTVIDVARYPIHPVVRHDGPLRIGWVGLPSTMKYLKEIREPLVRLAARTNIEFRIISSRSAILPGVPVRYVRWSEEAEAEAIADLDIGVMPLPDTEWARGKCAAKLLQYMAAGRTAVASPVGVNADIINHGSNGCLAKGPDDWFRILRGLADNLERRVHIGRIARQKVEREYSLQVWGPKVVDLYRRILEG